MRPFRWIAGVLALLLVLALPARAEPDYPAFTAPIVDAAHILTDAQIGNLTRKVLDLQTKTGTQFAVATVPSLGGEEIEPYANELFRKWGIGKKDVNNGLLLILAPNERKLRFEVGYGLEGTMTDVQSKLILHNAMVPKLKAGDPAGALAAGVDDAIKVLTGDSADITPAPVAAEDAPLDTSTLIILGIVISIALLILYWIIIPRLRRRGWVDRGIIGGAAGSSWSSGDSSSSDGGGGFSGGGGGDSGGGGASDSY